MTPAPILLTNHSYGNRCEREWDFSSPSFSKIRGPRQGKAASLLRASLLIEFTKRFEARHSGI